MDLCPRGDGAEPQPGCACRAQLGAGLTHEGRFPLQQHRLQQQQPWDKAQPQLAHREHTRARPWGQVGTEPGLTLPWSSQRASHGMDADVLVPWGERCSHPEPSAPPGACGTRCRGCTHCTLSKAPAAGAVPIASCPRLRKHSHCWGDAGLCQMSDWEGELQAGITIFMALHKLH